MAQTLQHSMTFKEVFTQLEKMGTAQNRKIYARHGGGPKMFGVSFANLKALQNKIISPEGEKRVNHDLALQLWST